MAWHADLAVLETVLPSKSGFPSRERQVERSSSTCFPPEDSWGFCFTGANELQGAERAAIVWTFRYNTSDRAWPGTSVDLGGSARCLDKAQSLIAKGVAEIKYNIARLHRAGRGAPPVVELYL